MLNPQYAATPVAQAIPFSAAGFTSTDVQDAIIEAKASATATAIPQVYVDPVSPAANQVWVLATGPAPGSPFGLLLAITSASYTYKLKYFTTEGTKVSVTLG